MTQDGKNEMGEKSTAKKTWSLSTSSVGLKFLPASRHGVVAWQGGVLKEYLIATLRLKNSDH